jgi:uncharacterized protein YraI
MAYGTTTTSTPGSTLNFRQSPTTSSAVLASIPHGSTITITGPAQNGWYPVSIGQYSGYVSAQYVNPFTPTATTGGSGPSTPTTPPPTAPAGPYGTSTTKTPGSTLNLRQGPSTGTSVLGSIPHGAQITITGAAQNGWYPVTYNGKTGYVSAQYVNPFTPSSGGGGTGTTPAPTTPSTPPPAGIPHTPAAPNTPQASNPYYNPDSTYGSHQNWYNTPLVSQTQDFTSEWEKFATDQGYGGNTTKSNIARNLIDRAQPGFNAATMNNPDLTPRNYLNQTLGANFFRNQLAGMTPGQKGEMPSIFSPRGRWNPR